MLAHVLPQIIVHTNIKPRWRKLHIKQEENYPSIETKYVLEILLGLSFEHILYPSLSSPGLLIWIPLADCVREHSIWFLWHTPPPQRAKRTTVKIQNPNWFPLIKCTFRRSRKQKRTTTTKKTTKATEKTTEQQQNTHAYTEAISYFIVNLSHLIILGFGCVDGIN